MSGLGSFSQCLVDGDVQALGRMQRLRRRSLIAAMALEAAFVAAMLLLPLITPGVLTQKFFATPAVPYHGGGSTAPERSRGPAHPNGGNVRSTISTIIAQPPLIPAHAQTNSANEAPEDSAGLGIGSGNVLGGAGSGPGDFLAGGSDSGTQPIPMKPPATPQKPRRISEGVMQAELVNKIQPEYPAAARLLHIAGTVQLRAIIAKDGSIRELEAVSGNPILTRAALAAVSKWRYRPT